MLFECNKCNKCKDILIYILIIVLELYLQYIRLKKSETVLILESDPTVIYPFEWEKHKRTEQHLKLAIQIF